MFTTASQSETPVLTKEARLTQIKRAKFFHKNSSNPRFASNPMNQKFDAQALLSETGRIHNGVNIPKAALLFRGNVKLV